MFGRVRASPPGLNEAKRSAIMDVGRTVTLLLGGAEAIGLSISGVSDSSSGTALGEGGKAYSAGSLIVCRGEGLGMLGGMASSKEDEESRTGGSGRRLKTFGILLDIVDCARRRNRGRFCCLFEGDDAGGWLSMRVERRDRCKRSRSMRLLRRV